MHWEDPEGWDGEGGGRGDRDGEHMQIHVNVWQKPLQYCKVINLQLIKINEKIKIKKKKESTILPGRCPVISVCFRVDRRIKYPFQSPLRQWFLVGGYGSLVPSDFLNLGGDSHQQRQALNDFIYTGSG